MQSTDAICPTSNRLTFVADGHFTPAANAKLAEVLAEILRRTPPKARPTADAGRTVRPAAWAPARSGVGR